MIKRLLTLFAVVSTLAACNQAPLTASLDTTSLGELTLVTDDLLIAEALNTVGITTEYVETEELTDAFLDTGAALSFTPIPEEYRLPPLELERDSFWCDPRFCDPAGFSVAFSYNALHLTPEHVARLVDETSLTPAELGTLSADDLRETGSIYEDIDIDCKSPVFKWHPKCLIVNLEIREIPHNTKWRGYICVLGTCEYREEELWNGTVLDVGRAVFLDSLSSRAQMSGSLMLTGEGVGPSLFRAELSVRADVDPGVATELMERLTQPDVQRVLTEQAGVLPASNEAFGELDSGVQEGALSAFTEGVGSFGF